MKSITKILSLLILVISVVSCDEEDHFQDFDATLSPVYSLVDISNNGPFKINVYREQPLIIEYANAVNAKSYKSTGFTDASTDLVYDISITKIVDVIDVDGIKTGEESISYLINADKETGSGTLTIDSVNIHDITISEEEVFN